MKLIPSDFIWRNGELIPWADATIHALSHVVHYGSGVFEGIRAYPGDGGPNILGLTEHVRRLFESCRIIGLPLDYEPSLIEQAVVDTVRANKHETCYIRPFAFRGYGELGVDPTTSPVEMMIATFPWGALMGTEALEQGVDVAVSSWRRMAPSTHPAMAKASGNYLNSQLVVMEAKANGFAEGIVLDVDGYVAEGSGENIFVVRDDRVLTPPCGGSILAGVTRGYVLELARDAGIEVVEQRIAREMLYTCDELFFTGTAAEVTPVRSVDRRRVGSGKRGPITALLQRNYFDRVYGRVEDRSGWLTPVR
ncbi:MAG: branched-chain amino acid transaminase [Planctomycetes bacterium]|nr:branched-chain amino acid transaminase [Planctomycetota bacterium]